MVKIYEKVCTNRLFLLGISGDVLLDLPDPFTCSTMQVSDAQANTRITHFASFRTFQRLLGLPLARIEHVIGESRTSEMSEIGNDHLPHQIVRPFDVSHHKTHLVLIVLLPHLDEL